MNSLGSYWTRFVNVCASTSRTAGGALLHKSATEWQGLTDLTKVLLRNCPASRLAVLDHLTPLFGEYFVLWWQHHHLKKEGSQVAPIDVPVDGFEDLFAAEPVLCDIARMLRELILLNSGSDEFASGVCSWVLARLRPACIIPPTQMLSSLRRLLHSNSRSKISFGWKSNQSKETSKSMMVDAGLDLDDDPKGITRTRIKEPNAAGQRTHRPASSESESSDSENTDDAESISPEVTPAVPMASESVTTLDLSSTSTANKQLLGPWAHCGVLLELLHLAYELIMGSAVRLSTIQALLAIATVPLPPELSAMITPSQLGGYIPSPSSVLPHWVVIWLLYQVSRDAENGAAAIQHLVDLILDASVQFPLAPEVILDSMGNTPDTLTGWVTEQRVDAHFWMTSCLTHLLFLGDQAGVFVSGAITRRLKQLISSSGDNTTTKAFDDPGTSCQLISLVLHLGLLSVPTPPPSPAALSVPPGSIPTSNTSSPQVPGRSDVRQFRAHGPDPSLVVYDGPSQMFKNPMAQCPSGGLYGRHFGPRHAHHPLRPTTVPFPFTNPSLLPVGQPGSTVPGPGLLPNQPISSWRPPSMHLHTSSLQSRGMDQQSGSELKSRQPASLIWLLNLANSIRSFTISSVIDQLIDMNPPQLYQLLSGLSYSTGEKQQLLQMTTEVILTAPENSGCDHLLAFLLKSSMTSSTKFAANEDSEVVLLQNTSIDWLSNVCTRLLTSVCTSMLCMVYGRSEAADTLNRGGCKGLLHAAQRLLTSVGPHSVIPNLLDFCDSSTIFRYLVNASAPASLVISLCQILVALELTIEPNVIINALVHLCSASPDDHSHVDASHTPLDLFFPLLEELEACRNARLLGSLTKSIPPLKGLTLPLSSSYTHSFLASQLLPRLWTSVVESSTRHRTLSSLVSLVQREKLLCSSRSIPPRLLPAIATQLVPLLRLMSTIHDNMATHLLLSLFEQATTLVVGHAAHHPTPQTGATGLTLSVSQCVSIGRLSIQVARTLLKRSETKISTPADLTSSLQLFQRMQEALTILADCYPLLRSTALRCATSAAAFSDVCETKSPDFTLFVPPTRGSTSVRSFDWHRMATPTCLPDVVLDSNGRGGSLLLTNPPPDGGPHAGDSLARGQLRKRTRTTEEASCLKRTPGSSSNGFANPDGPLKPHALSSTAWHPIHFHWLRLIDRLTGELDMKSAPSKAQESSIRHRAHLVGCGLQNLLLPLGAHLPQTTIAHLPNPLALVLAPTGIGLERTIALLHCFCPEVKAHAIGQCGPDNLATRTRVFTQLLENLLFQVLNKEEYLQKHLAISRERSQAVTVDVDPFVSILDKQETLFPCPKILLGLLMGLEAIWACPLAPRISIPNALAYYSANQGQYAQGIFPIKWSPDVGLAQARRLAVEYGQRRVDCQSALFRLTKQLLIVLYKLCYLHDCSILLTSNTASLGDQRPESTHLPLDRLLYCVTPRELAILLSDIRRNLRLRMAFDWIQHRKPSFNKLTTDSMDVTPPTADNLPPPPAFITPGLLVAVLHSHLIEPGVAELVGPLLNSMHIHHPTPDSIRFTEPNDPAVLEEVDVDGELVVVLND